MDAEERGGFTLPTRLARRRLFVGRLILSVVCANALLALAAAYFLSGAMAGVTRFEFGFLGWVGILFPASLFLAIPIMAPIVVRILRPRDATPAGERERR